MFPTDRRARPTSALKRPTRWPTSQRPLNTAGIAAAVGRIRRASTPPMWSLTTSAMRPSSGLAILCARPDEGLMAEVERQERDGGGQRHRDIAADAVQLAHRVDVAQERHERDGRRQERQELSWTDPPTRLRCEQEERTAYQ